MECFIVVSPLPKLMGIKCSLLNREIPTDQRGCRIDFTSAVTYYRVLLIVYRNTVV